MIYLLSLSKICTQQLGFLGNCQWKLNFWLVYTKASHQKVAFPGAVSNLNEIIGVSYVSQFRLLTTITLCVSGEQSLVRFRILHNVRTCETCCCALCNIGQTLKSHRRKVPCPLTLPVFHIQGVSPIEECRWKRALGVKSSIDKYSTTFELIFTFD